MGAKLYKLLIYKENSYFFHVHKAVPKVVPKIKNEGVVLHFLLCKCVVTFT